MICVPIQRGVKASGTYGGGGVIVVVVVIVIVETRQWTSDELVDVGVAAPMSQTHVDVIIAPRRKRTNE